MSIKETLNIWRTNWMSNLQINMYGMEIKHNNFDHLQTDENDNFYEL